MEIRELIYGRNASAEGGNLRHVFSRPADGPVRLSDLLSTFNGIGTKERGREGGLKVMERLKLISAEQRATAGGGGVGELTAGAEELAAGADEVVRAGAGTAPRAGFAAGAAGAASIAPDNPIYGGLYAQMLVRKHGFQVPAARPEQLRDAAPVADEVVDAAKPVVAAAPETPIAAAADDAAAKLQLLERRFVEGFQRLGALPEEQRIPSLARAIDAGAAAGHGDDAFGVLARELAARPMEHAVDALHSSIDDAGKAVPKVADVVEKAAPVADDVATKAAPVADDAHPAIRAALGQLGDDLKNGTLQHVDEAYVALYNSKLGALQLVPKADLAKVLPAAEQVVAKAAPVLDDVVKAAPAAEQVVAKAAPVLDDVAHAAAAVVKPQVVEAALPVADDAVRHGLKGIMGFSAGIDDTLRLISLVR